MAEGSAHRRSVEPLRALIRERLDALGWDQTKAAKVTGISDQQMSNLLRRTRPYGNRPPTFRTLEQLEKIPSLSRDDIHSAVADSMGLDIAREATDADTMTPQRRTAHGLIDEFPEEQLPQVLQFLLALRKD